MNYTQKYRMRHHMWLSALRSGQFVQRQDLMQTPGDPRRCCALGVALTLAEATGARCWGSPVDFVGDWLGLPDNTIDYVMHLNDIAGKSFLEIADEMEKKLGPKESNACLS